LDRLSVTTDDGAPVGPSLPSSLRPLRATRQAEEQVMDDAYEAPQLVEIGTLHELTLQDKDFGGDDGLSFLGQTIGNNS
jgi:hypothetical protein